jgi:hypothetical protein
MGAFSLFSNHYKLAMVSKSGIGLTGFSLTGLTYFAVESSYAAKPPVGRGYDGLVRRNHRRKRHE